MIDTVGLIDMLAYQRWRLKTGQVDYHDGRIDRQRLESIQQDHRNAKAILDESFADICQRVTGTYYTPLDDHAAMYQLRHSSGIVGIYFRSPESLDIRSPIETSLVNENDGTNDLDAWEEVGRTNLELLVDGEPTSQAYHLLYNGDHNHLLLLLDLSQPNNAKFVPGDYCLRFIYHRYDRPVRSYLGLRNSDEADIWWTMSPVASKNRNSQE